jgi:2'-5' RNA ligase
VRTFVAIDLDEHLKTDLLALIGGLARLADNVRWVSDAGLHLTLKFLGETSDDQAAAIAGVLKSVCAQFPSFGLKLKGLGFFPPGRRSPRVIWVGIESQPRLMSLQRDVEAAVEKLGFEREARAFQPHLTLGRVKFPGRMDALLGEIERRREEDFGETAAVKATFFQSVLKPAGAEYSVLAEFPLS